MNCIERPSNTRIRGADAFEKEKMEKSITICDRCGKEREEGSRKYIQLHHPSAELGIDLCISCNNEFLLFIKGITIPPLSEKIDQDCKKED